MAERPEADLDLRTAADFELGGPAGAAALPVRTETPAAPRTTVVRDVGPGAPATKAPDVVILAMSDECADLFAALAAAQGEFGDVDRTLEARIQSQRTGGAYTYAYESLADVLAAVRPALSKHGIAVLQFPFTRAASIVLRTMLVYGKAGGRGQWLYNELIASIADTSPQAIGSGITFLRRYALKSILGLAAGYEDDDGAAASTRPIEPAPRKAEAPKAASAPKRPDPPMPASIPGKQASQRSEEPLRPTRDDAQTGAIVEVRDVAGVAGAALIRLANGFIAGTRDPEIVQAARRYLEEQPAPAVELVTRAASGAGRAPTVIELRPLAEDPS